MQGYVCVFARACPSVCARVPVCVRATTYKRQRAAVVAQARGRVKVAASC
jgi:hypothetical protein